MKEDEDIIIHMPQYFDELEEPPKYFGTLSKEGNYWIIRAEPQVTQMIKKLFPMTMIKRGGEAKFPTNKRQIGELNWFMMRFPLKIEDIGLWRQEFEDAKLHFANREIIRKSYAKEEPHELKFKGNLFDFQKEGLSFISCNKRCLLADEMGLGKTAQSIALLSKLESPTVIVVPPHLINQWVTELHKFLGDDIKIQILTGLNPKNCPIDHNADIYIVHYLILRGWYNEIKTIDYDTIIFDEIQELRHRTSQKYQAAQEISEYKSHVIGLSGTPIYNYGAEIWNLMNIIEPYCLGDWEFFTLEWCGGWGMNLLKEPQKLGKYLYEEGLMLRRRKEDVLPELPPKRKIVQNIELNKELYINMIDKSVQLAKKIPTMVSRQEKKKIGAMMLDAVNNARRASGIAKASHVCDFVNLVLESGEPCILFAYHHSVVDIYMRLLSKHNPVKATGRETRDEKTESIRQFMEEETDLIIINLRTTAGLNLQRARCVIFGELDWSPAVHKQAEDRIHRIGQSDSVLAYYLVAPTPSDEKIGELLGVKEWQFNGLMNDKEATKEDEVLAQRANTKFISEILDNIQDDVNIDIAEEDVEIDFTDDFVPDKEEDDL